MTTKTSAERNARKRPSPKATRKATVANPAEVSAHSQQRPDTTSKGGKQPKDRWTETLVADGWTPVSDFFLKNYSRLSPPITSTEAMFIVHLLSFKWTAAAPWPSFKTIASRMGVSTTAARGYARSLDKKKKYLRREFRTGAPNVFHLDKLFEKLEAYRESDPPKRRARDADPYAKFKPSA